MIINENIMTPTLNQIFDIPDSLYKFLVDKNLTPLFKRQRKHPIFNFPVNIDNSFLWGKFNIRKNHSIYNFKFINDDLFYSIIFPDYSKSEIKQLNSLIFFIEKLFNANIHNLHDEESLFTVMPSCIHAEKSHFRIKLVNNQSFEFLTNHCHIDLDNLSFDSVYFSLLKELKIKIEKYFCQENMFINTHVFNNMLNESCQEYLDRLYSDAISKPITTKEFLESIHDEKLKQIIIQHNKPKNKIKEFKRNLGYNDLETSFSINLPFDNLKELKKILRKSMNVKDIDCLFYILSLIEFYYQVLKQKKEPIQFVFTRYNHNNLNKSDLSHKYYVYSISVANENHPDTERILFGDDVMYHRPHNTNNIKFKCINDLYNTIFEDVTAKICKILETDRDKVTVLDLKVIEMTIF